MLRKRVLTAVLAFLLLMSTIAIPTNAATSSEEKALLQKITSTYKRLRAANGNRSYNGYCGKMAAYTLYYLGVDKRVNMNNGKDEYDVYKDLTVSTGGYAVDAYPATRYSMEEALNAICEGGTKDVYNILLGFQKTNTDAGRRYGHAVVIYGILDGNVYFTESFSLMGKKEGEPIVCTIEKFCEYYNRWTTYEGAVYFGTKSYADFCTYYPADLFVQTTGETPVYSIPSDVNVSGHTAKQTAVIAVNERLEVSGLYKNTKGEMFYEITYGRINGYVKAEKLQLLRLNSHKVTKIGFNTPKALRKGQDFAVTGSVFLQQDGLANLNFSITDEAGDVKYSYLMKKDGTMATVGKAVNDALKFNKLSDGVYTYKVTCDIENYVVIDGKATSQTETVTLVDKKFTVGGATLPSGEVITPDEEGTRNGWHFDVKDHLWKYYTDGALASGWVFADDADYYILQDGTAATGRVEINGEYRYFTETGAMCTGWYETENGRIYLLSNGTTAKGWYRVQGTPCYFGEDGVWDEDAAYTPEELPELEAHTDHMFTTLFESLSKFTEQCEDFFE